MTMLEQPKELEQYYKEFPTYNPFLENLPGARGGAAGGGGAKGGKNSTNASKFKVYSLDGDSKGDLSAQTAAITAINSRRWVLILKLKSCRMSILWPKWPLSSVDVVFADPTEVDKTIDSTRSSSTNVACGSVKRV